MKEEKMKIVVGVVSQKGGVGKSSIVRALSREGSNAGLNVKIADLDTQQSTSMNWVRRRLEAEIEPAIRSEQFKTISQAMETIENHDLLVIDGPARASKGTFEIASESDLVIQPTGASLDDLEPAVLLFHELRQKGIKREKLLFALSRVGTASEERQCREYLAEAGYSVLDGCIYEKPSYRQAQNKGLAITEVPHQGLRKSADLLIQSLIDKLSDNG